MKKNWLEKIIFGVTLLFCIISFLLAFMCFTINLTSTSTALKRLSNDITSYISCNYVDQSIESDTLQNPESEETTSENTESEAKNVALKIDSIKEAISYLERLKEIESTSVSTNLLTFLYTFLSSVLIGLGTFFMKKNVDNTKLICDSKELIDTNKKRIDEDSKNIEANQKQIKENESRIKNSVCALNKVENDLVYAEQYLCLQQISTTAYNISTILTFSKDLEIMPEDIDKKKTFFRLLGTCLPRFNESIRDLSNYFRKHPNELMPNNKRKIKQELAEIISIIRYWNDPMGIITENEQKKWIDEITSIMNLV